MRIRIATLTSLLLLVATLVSSETIRFDPPNPTGSRSVDAIVTGIWPNACLPLVKSVVIAATTVTLHFDATPPPGVLCAQSTGPYTRTFHLGIVPPGGYTVILVADAGSTSTELARAPLIVRDAEMLSIFPYAVPITGGGISLANPFFLAAATLTIGGVTVPADSNIDGLLFANTPPHAAGVVDVTVNSIAGPGAVTSKAALIYYDPAAADPAVFEPILFPVSFQGPGALGSQWLTESFINGNGSQAFFRDPLPCTGCSQTLTLGSKQLTNDGLPWGHVLYPLRGTTSFFDLASRIRDTSRQSQTAGTEVPVVRERDFRSQLRFMNLPVDARYRVTLRLWSLSDGGPLIASVDSTPAQSQGLTLSRIPGTSMSFGSMDVTSLLTKANNNPTNLAVTSPANVPFPPPIWGMLSITNNDTQQVTIVSPH
ncbi:MAG TPA: hypothetical protein VGQ21_21800 [Thermoanaerobaculia bacterium]|jgi:hypothetical protein|nr:hypothetical protein [Thermoanaerobaculia bacterium]